MATTTTDTTSEIEVDRGVVQACIPTRRAGGPTVVALCRRCNRWHQLEFFTGAGRCRFPDTRNLRPETPPDPLNATLLGLATLPHG